MLSAKWHLPEHGSRVLHELALQWDDAGFGYKLHGPYIACCLPDGSCQELDPVCCIDLGGSLSSSPICQGDNNQNGVDDACELPCKGKCGDVNGDNGVNVSDVVRIVNFVFIGGNPPGDCSPGDPDWSGEDCCEFTPQGIFDNTSLWSGLFPFYNLQGINGRRKKFCRSFFKHWDNIGTN